MSRHDELIDRFEAGGPMLRTAASGLTRQDILARPGPGKWSILELAVHMADSDAVAIDRMKRILAEENPTLLSFDENLYIARLHCESQELADALDLFDIGRRQFARVLRALKDADFDRAGTHNVAGRVTVAGLLKGYCDHLDHHLKFLDGKRRRLGK